MVISLARRHTLLGCETKAMITEAMEIKANGDQSSDTTCKIDKIKIYPFPNFKSLQILATYHKSSNQPTHGIAAECKSLHMKVKGRSLEGANTM